MGDILTCHDMFSLTCLSCEKGGVALFQATFFCFQARFRPLDDDISCHV